MTARADRYTPRRGLRRTEAAAFLGISATKFDDMVKAGRMPSGFVLDGCRIWDINDLDVAFDALKAESAQTAPRARVMEFDSL